MTKLEKLFNRFLVFVVFLSTGARLAVARIFPASPLSQKPPSAKVFALTEAAWLELRAASDGVNQEKNSVDDQKEGPKSREGNKDSSKKSDAGKEQSKSKDCDKDGSKSRGENKGASPSGDDKKGDASKSGECGPGGGDGNTGGSGG